MLADHFPQFAHCNQTNMEIFGDLHNSISQQQQQQQELVINLQKSIISVVAVESYTKQQQFKPLDLSLKPKQQQIKLNRRNRPEPINLSAKQLVISSSTSPASSSSSTASSCTVLNSSTASGNNQAANNEANTVTCSPTTTTSSTTSAKKQLSRASNSTGKSRKSHLCRDCGKLFARSDMLTRHQLCHSGVKPYECSKCKQVFSRKDHLSTHERTHTGEKPYQCDHCPYTACRRDMITRHTRTHLRRGSIKKRSARIKKSVILAKEQANSQTTSEEDSEGTSPATITDKQITLI